MPAGDELNAAAATADRRLAPPTGTVDVVGFPVDLDAYEQAARRQERLAGRLDGKDARLAAEYRRSARSIREDAAWMAAGAHGLAPSLQRRLAPAPARDIEGAARG